MRLCVAAGLALTATGFAAQPPSVFEAEAARLNEARLEIVSQPSFSGGRGVGLKSGADADGKIAAPDVTFAISAKPGRYTVTTHAAVDDVGAELMRKARTKFESLFVRLQVGEKTPTRRVVFVPWSKPDSCIQQLGVFDFAGQVTEVKMWLPRGVRLDRLELQPYQPPAVPKEAANYQPSILPPAAHPRLWVNPEALGRIRANLSHPENKPAWDAVRAEAAKPFSFSANDEVAYNTPLEQAALARAFCHLVQNDGARGREAVSLMLAYLPHVEFGNLLDITREMGAAIYAGACVYDWCYDLLRPDERDLLRRHLMRLAEEMECGWPPFRSSIVNGHGNEAMINRDLLSLAIAVYNEDPLPYRYCAYAVLEQLVPMRTFEYQSARHNQGVSYGAYRFGWEMHDAWLFRRLAGREVFAPNIKTVPQYWLYLRLPNGEMLRDGDGVPAGKYWNYAQTALLCYAYNGDRVVKGEFFRQGGLPKNPILFLLLNDPAVRPEPSLAGLPLTKDFGPVLGGMIARTGWNMGADSRDVVAEVKGGGYHFGNHQHADAGALQIYYRGLQVAPLAEYGFYGTPYDMNFAKRSIAQAMVRVIDPHEKVLRDLANDGGSRFLQSNPRTPAQAKTDASFHYGRVVSCSFGPDSAAPDTSYFCADLQSAYTDKLSAYTRQFVFLNLHRRDVPAAMIVVDDLTTSNPGFEKIWQLTTFKPPRQTDAGVQLWNDAGGTAGRLDVALLEPRQDDRRLEIISGPDVHRVGAKVFPPPSPEAPEAKGLRIVVSPTMPRARDRFVALLQATDADPLPYAFEETEALAIVRIANRVVALAKTPGALAQSFEFTLPAGAEPADVALVGLRAGVWRINDETVTVAPGKNTCWVKSPGGRLRAAPID